MHSHAYQSTHAGIGYCPMMAECPVGKNLLQQQIETRKSYADVGVSAGFWEKVISKGSKTSRLPQTLLHKSGAAFDTRANSNRYIDDMLSEKQEKPAFWKNEKWFGRMMQPGIEKAKKTLPFWERSENESDTKPVTKSESPKEKCDCLTGIDEPKTLNDNINSNDLKNWPGAKNF
jgi:hypothetical protein